jgi:hypothetical protein
MTATAAKDRHKEVQRAQKAAAINLANIHLTRKEKTDASGVRLSGKAERRIDRLQQSATSDLEQDIRAPDFWKTRLRLFVRWEGHTIDISRLCDTISWQDVSSDNLRNINTQAAMTGSITLHKPPLRQYDKLAPLVFPGISFSARVAKDSSYLKPGAMGSQIVCQVGYGDTYSNLWVMRVVPGYNQDTAEAVTLSDGSWTLTLADDLWLLAQNVADFKYTKGKKIRPHGWRCDEIAHDLCVRYRIPVRTLAQGTSYFGLSHPQTTLTSPIHVITEAYHEETKRTGRTFIIRWGAPNKQFPFGALEVVPMRRNRLLYAFREQLTEASLSRSQSPDFATVILARGQIVTGTKKKKKTRKVEYTATSDMAVRRNGFIRKTVNFGNVESEHELRVLAQRTLAVRLVPIRTAELTNPGIATIRRGDAVRIDLPEEGYTNVTLLPYSGMKKSHSAALRQAEKLDPALFNLPTANVGAISPQSSNAPLDKNIPVTLPVANQGIAYVTSAAHTASAGSYTMDLQMGFINVLDPAEMRAQIDQHVRKYKADTKNAAALAKKKAAAAAKKKALEKKGG